MSIINDLTAPVSEESPCGENLEYDSRFLELEQVTEGLPEHMMTAEPSEEEGPDWKKARELALSLLKETRDLRVTVHLTRALVHTDGLPGVDEGLGLIREYLERYWECVHPQLDPDEDNDPTFRINTLEILDDPFAFVTALKDIPLVEAKGVGQFTLRHIEQATSGENENLTPELIAAAFHEADPESVGQTCQHIANVSEHLQAIQSSLSDKIDPELIPPFKRLGALIEDARHTLSRFAALSSEPDESAVGTVEETVSHTFAPPAQGFNSREEIARTIEKMCEYFERNEPTSPVPLLLQRARRLMTMNFMELVEELANDGSHQAATILGMTDDED